MHVFANPVTFMVYTHIYIYIYIYIYIITNKFHVRMSTTQLQPALSETVTCTAEACLRLQVHNMLLIMN